MRNSTQPEQSNRLCLPRLACATASRFREHEITGERNRGRNGRRERDGGVWERGGEFTAGQGAYCDMERNPLSPWRHWVHDGIDTKRKKSFTSLQSVPTPPPQVTVSDPFDPPSPSFLVFQVCFVAFLVVRDAGLFAYPQIIDTKMSRLGVGAC